MLALGSFMSQAFHSWESVAVTIVVTIWGVRLSVYLFLRNWHRPEDFRYAAWRKNWGKRWVLFSILKVYLLQGAVMQFIAIPIFISNVCQLSPLSSFTMTKRVVVILLGALMALLGIFIESWSDYQKYIFKLQAGHEHKFCNTGLWSISRHPNYLGEILHWVGVSFIPLGLEWGWVGLMSPLLITFLLYFVSGVPLLEQRFLGRADFLEYQKNTGAIFPTLKWRNRV